jgi:hypothetical protein
MGDKGKKDKGKREHQKKAQLSLKEKRKVKKKRRTNKCPLLSGELKSSKEVVWQLLEIKGFFVAGNVPKNLYSVEEKKLAGMRHGQSPNPKGTERLPN